YPFCAYSPEYVALREGQAVGAQLQFCDLPAAVTLTWSDRDDDGAAPGDDRANGQVEAAAVDESDAENRFDGGYPRFAAALVEAANADSFEAFWEAAFEQESDLRPVDGYV